MGLVVKMLKSFDIPREEYTKTKQDIHNYLFNSKDRGIK